MYNYTATSVQSCCHYNDVIMSAMVSQITSLTIVYSNVYQRIYQSSALLASVMGIHRTNSQQRGNVSIWWRHHVMAWCWHKRLDSSLVLTNLHWWSSCTLISSTYRAIVCNVKINIASYNFDNRTLQFMTMHIGLDDHSGHWQFEAKRVYFCSSWPCLPWIYQYRIQKVVTRIGSMVAITTREWHAV